MIETEMTAIVSNPIINLPAAIFNGDGSSPSQRVIDIYSFPKELVEWIKANQSSSFERMQRKSMRQPIYSEGDAMQYWLSRATIEDTYGNYTYEEYLHNANHPHTILLLVATLRNRIFIL